MTNKLRTQISYQAFCNPENFNLRNEYKQRRNRLISDLRNAEIKYYSNELDIHKIDVKQSWNIFKTIIGKHTNNIERKMSFSIKGAIVTGIQIIQCCE